MSFIFGRGGRADRRSIDLVTRKGNYISNEQRRERPPEALRDAVSFALSIGQGVRCRSATSVYNCFGLVFASRRTWILEPEQVPVILLDDEYRKLNTSDELHSGDVVIYKQDDLSISHVAIVVSNEPNLSHGSRSITVMSQWGADGEFVHSINEVPSLLGKPVEYWTDRKDLL